MSGLDHLDRDELQRELIWALSQCTDLTQEEIAGHPFVKKAQPSVSRILDDYDPAKDGFEIAATGMGHDDDLDEESLDEYREAIAVLMEHSPVIGGQVGMAKAGVSYD